MIGCRLTATKKPKWKSWPCLEGILRKRRKVGEAGKRPWLGHEGFGGVVERPQPGGCSKTAIDVENEVEYAGEHKISYHRRDVCRLGDRRRDVLFPAGAGTIWCA